MGFFKELKRRNVLRVGVAYTAGSWLLIQVADIVFEAWAAPAWSLRVLISLLAIGLPAALLVAWAYEWTPEGLRRESQVDRTRSIAGETGRRLDRAIIVILALALVYFAVDKFVLPTVPGSDETAETAGAPADPGAADSLPPLPDDRSLAVLPLENLGQDEADAVFASGIHNDLLTELARIQALRVVARSSVIRVSEGERSLREIAGLLNVAYVLEGGVQRAGDQVRVSLQLVDAATEAYLWAETFDRALTVDNLFAIQSEIAEAVTSALQTTLTAGDRARLAQQPTHDLAALEHYFEGVARMALRNESNLESARAAFRRAHEADPGFARALAAEAMAILLLRQGSQSYGSIPPPEAVAMAQPLVDRATSIAPDDPAVLASRGMLLAVQYRREEAVDFFRRSLAANPSDSETLNSLAFTLLTVGEPVEGRETWFRLVEVDPASLIGLFNAAVQAAQWQGAPAGRADAYVERLENLDPAWGAHARAAVAAIRGDVLHTIEWHFRTLERDPEFSQARQRLVPVLVRLGLAGEAMAIDHNIPESITAIANGDWPRAVSLARADFQSNPRDAEAAGRLAIALFGAGEWEQAQRLALAAFDAMGRNPFAWPAFNLLEVAWLATKTERHDVALQFLQMGRERLGRVRASQSMNYLIALGEAMLAVIEERPEEAAAWLERAVALGFRDRAALGTGVWTEVQNELWFQDQLRRLDERIATERAQVVAWLCGPEPRFPSHEPAPATCAES